MFTFLSSYWKIISFLLLLFLLGTFILAPEVAPTMTSIILFAGMGMALFFIVQRNRKALLQSKITRLQFVRNIVLEVLGFLLVLGVATYLGRLAGKAAEESFGVWAGLFAAITVSLAVGYLVRWGAGKITGSFKITKSTV